MLNPSSTDGSINTQFSASGSPVPSLSLGSKIKLATTSYNLKVPRLPSQLESIDEENGRSASQILLIADDQKTFQKFGSTNRGSMLPTIPFGKTSNLNSSKAATSRLYSVTQQTMHALGIINKAGKKRVFKDRAHRRYLYEGYHEVPVFNLKHQDLPVLLAFKFNVYRTAVKIYVEAKMLPQQTNHRQAYFVNRNKQLILELSERLAIKYMCMCDNDFAQMIETHLIVANNQLKIEKTTEYLVSDVHSTRGFFAYADELSVMSNTINTQKNTVSSRLDGNDADSQEYLQLYNQDSSAF